MTILSLSILVNLPTPTPTPLVINVISDGPQQVDFWTSSAFLALIGVLLGAAISFGGQWLILKRSIKLQMEKDIQSENRQAQKISKDIVRDVSTRILKVSRFIIEYTSMLKLMRLAKEARLIKENNAGFINMIQEQGEKTREAIERVKIEDFPLLALEGYRYIIDDYFSHVEIKFQLLIHKGPNSCTQEDIDQLYFLLDELEDVLTHVSGRLSE